MTDEREEALGDIQSGALELLKLIEIERRHASGRLVGTPSRWRC